MHFSCIALGVCGPSPNMVVFYIIKIKASTLSDFLNLLSQREKNIPHQCSEGPGPCNDWARGDRQHHKFVDILGLRTVFPLFMKTPKKMKRTGASEKEHEGQYLYSGRGRNVMDVFGSGLSSYAVSHFLQMRICCFFAHFTQPFQF